MGDLMKEGGAGTFKKISLIGQILLMKGLINSEQLEKAVNIQKITEDKLLGNILIKQGFITEESFYMAFADQCDLIYLPVERYNVSKDLLNMFPKELLLKYSFIPLERIDGVLNVALSDPFNEEAINTIQQRSVPCKIFWVMGAKTQIEKLIKTEY